MIEGLFKYTFIQNAVISAILASIACGIIGTIITEKKLVMMSGGIAHAAFGGVGLGYFLNIEPIIGALGFSVFSALGIANIRRHTKTNSDLLIGMFWSVGMALGIIFIALTPGYPPDMASYLFGDILTVTYTDLAIIIILDIIIITIVRMLYNSFLAYMFDEEFAHIAGINVKFIESLLYVLIALTIVIIIRIVGIILIIALLSIPTAVAKLFTYNLKNIMLISVLCAIGFCLSGLWLSYNFHVSSGACIILVSAFFYLIVSAGQKIYSKYSMHC